MLYPMSAHEEVSMLRGKCVLVTGGTGSFGRAMVSRALEQGCAEIRVFSRDEAKQDQMRQEFQSETIRYYIGDVRFRDSVDKAMIGVDYVFHAAALKQVPSCEFFPLEAVRTNTLGSINVIESAIAHRAKRLVCLSTDKAVQPVNAMGMTKALMEKAVQSASRDLSEGDTVVCCVRYGNVMYSRGSVIPRFVQQIASGQPLTVTDPAMTRFMLTLSDAIELVEYAFHYAEQGDIFIKKAPACTIEDLAEALKALFAAESSIAVIGRRHGEKLFETLATAEELRRADDTDGFYRIPADIRGLDYSLYFVQGDPGIGSRQDYTSHSTQQLDRDEVRKLLSTLPELKVALAAARARSANGGMH